MRRGSEGYEVGPINREEILMEYIQDEVGRVGRYQVYEPDTVSDHEADHEPGLGWDTDMVSDDDRPLGLRN
jgi:palmitoyltransferase